MCLSFKWICLFVKEKLDQSLYSLFACLHICMLVYLQLCAANSPTLVVELFIVNEFNRLGLSTFEFIAFLTVSVYWVILFWRLFDYSLFKDFQDLLKNRHFIINDRSNNTFQLPFFVSFSFKNLGDLDWIWGDKSRNWICRFAWRTTKSCKLGKNTGKLLRLVGLTKAPD